MIHGHKPHGFFQGIDANGKKVEGEKRQCIHCQHSWIYRPGSHTLRGYCLQCDGFLCAQPSCQQEQEKRVRQFQNVYGRTRSCVPFDEWHSRIRERVEKLLPLDPSLTITESGLIVPRSIY